MPHHLLILLARSKSQTGHANGRTRLTRWLKRNKIHLKTPDGNPTHDRKPAGIQRIASFLEHRHFCSKLAGVSPVVGVPYDHGHSTIGDLQDHYRGYRGEHHLTHIQTESLPRMRRVVTGTEPKHTDAPSIRMDLRPFERERADSPSDSIHQGRTKHHCAHGARNCSELLSVPSVKS